MTTKAPVNDESELDAQSDHSLVVKVALEASQSCFAELARRHAGLVLSGCCRMSLNNSDADDAAQAVFLIRWKKASSIGNRTSIADWLLCLLRVLHFRFLSDRLLDENESRRLT